MRLFKRYLFCQCMITPIIVLILSGHLYDEMRISNWGKLYFYFIWFWMLFGNFYIGWILFRLLTDLGFLLFVSIPSLIGFLFYYFFPNNDYSYNVMIGGFFIGICIIVDNAFKISFDDIWNNSEDS